MTAVDTAESTLAQLVIIIEVIRCRIQLLEREHSPRRRSLLPPLPPATQGKKEESIFLAPTNGRTTKTPIRERTHSRISHSKTRSRRPSAAQSFRPLAPLNGLLSSVGGELATARPPRHAPPTPPHRVVGLFDDGSFFSQTSQRREVTGLLTLRNDFRWK